MKFLIFLFLFFMFIFPGVVFDFIFSHEYQKVVSIVNPVCLFLFGSRIN